MLLVCLFTHPTPASGTVTPPTANTIPWTLRSFKGNTTIASWVFTKPAEAGDVSTFVYTSTGTAAYHVNFMSRFTHTSGTAPPVDAVATPLEVTSASPQFPAVTTVTANDLIVAIGSAATQSWSSPGDGFTLITQVLSQAIYRRTSTTPGVYGPTSVTLSSSVINDTHCIALAGL
jgi:hypothetical protein